MDWLIAPLAYDFMRSALVAAALVGILCPVVGTFLIVQRMALMGNVLSHSVLPGLALAYALRIPLLLGAFVFGLLSTLLISWVRSHSRVKADAIMAITMSSFFALGVVLISVLKTQLDLEGFLFGNILTIQRTDIGQVMVITLLTVVAVALFYKELLFFTFDRAGAQAVGLPVQTIDFGLTIATTLAIVGSLKTVGVILVLSMMVGPAITAYLWVRELHTMLVVSSGVGIGASLTGIYLSYYFDWPSGAAIALVIFALFAVSFGVSPTQGGWQRWLSVRPSRPEQQPPC